MYLNQRFFGDLLNAGFIIDAKAKSNAKLMREINYMYSRREIVKVEHILVGAKFCVVNLLLLSIHSKYEPAFTDSYCL